MKYRVLLNESKEGFSVSCPGLPGCWSQGATEEEALENIQDAISEYLAALHEELTSTVSSLISNRPIKAGAIAKCNVCDPDRNRIRFVHRGG